MEKKALLILITGNLISTECIHGTLRWYPNDQTRRFVDLDNGWDVET